MIRMQQPFALSLSKGKRLGFDKLSPNGAHR
jgi:hypothetical protein